MHSVNGLTAEDHVMKSISGDIWARNFFIHRRLNLGIRFKYIYSTNFAFASLKLESYTIVNLPPIKPTAMRRNTCSATKGKAMLRKGKQILILM